MKKNKKIKPEKYFIAGAILFAVFLVGKKFVWPSIKDLLNPTDETPGTTPTTVTPTTTPAATTTTTTPAVTLQIKGSQATEGRPVNAAESIPVYYYPRSGAFFKNAAKGQYLGIVDDIQDDGWIKLLNSGVNVYFVGTHLVQYSN